eukprot:6204901-Amphidinium_carterae.1
MEDNISGGKRTIVSSCLCPSFHTSRFWLTDQLRKSGQSVTRPSWRLSKWWASFLTLFLSDDDVAGFCPPISSRSGQQALL